MVKITGYKQVDFTELHSLLKKTYDPKKKSHFKIATEINAKSTQTAANAFMTPQKVSDETLTSVMKSIGIDSLIAYHEGEKIYYIKAK